MGRALGRGKAEAPNLACQNFLYIYFCIGFSCFWPAKLFLASQNLILSGQKNFGQADGMGFGGGHFPAFFSFHILA